MKEGDYVRTKKGIIGKYNIVKTGETIPNWNGGYGYKEIEKEYIDNNIYNRFDDEIIKSSPNIIDLIEVGDYVNGMEVTSIENDTKGKYIFGYTCDGLEGETWFYQNDIKSIVTKEQFESMEYKVEE